MIFTDIFWIFFTNVHLTYYLASINTVKVVNDLDLMVIDFQNFAQPAFEINFYFSYAISAKKLEIAAFFL